MADISKTADQALMVLLELSKRAPLTAAELASKLQLNRTVVHRSLATLHRRGFVTRQRDGYVPGSILVRIAARVQPQLREIARRVMVELSEQTGETVVLDIRDGDDAVILEQVVPENRVLRVEHQIGFRHPLISGASGRAILAHMPRGTAERIIKKNAPEPDAVRAQIREMRRLGFGISRDELQDGVCGLAVPVLEPDGVLIASIVLLVPTSRGDRLIQHKDRLVDGAAQLAQSLADVEWETSPALLADPRDARNVQRLYEPDIGASFSQGPDLQDPDLDPVAGDGSPATSHLRVGEVAVAYRRRGQGAPLLYLHGMGLTREWLDLYEALARHFDVIVPEHPGFGDTPRPAWYRGLDDIAIHYDDVLTALGLDSVHVVGHSLGGRIAASFAALYPSRTRSLTLIAPSALPTVTPAELLSPVAPPPDFDFGPLLFNDNQTAYPGYVKGDDLGLLVTPSDDEHDDPESWSTLGAPTLYRRLARVHCPTQILAPDEDRIVPEFGFAAWSRALGDAPIVPIVGRLHPTGHLLVVQEVDAITDAISELAGGVDVVRS